MKLGACSRQEKWGSDWETDGIGHRDRRGAWGRILTKHQRILNLSFCQHRWLAANWVRPCLYRNPWELNRELGSAPRASCLESLVQPNCWTWGQAAVECHCHNKSLSAPWKKTVSAAVQFSLANRHKSSIPELNHMGFLNVSCCCCFWLFKKKWFKLIQKQSGDTENLFPRHRKASESSKISSGSFSDGINSYSHSLN